MSKIVLEDFSKGNGHYKVNLAYLNKEQVEVIESLVFKWNQTDEDIKNCIWVCLTDANEQRFKDYGTNLKDCLAWLKKQGEQKQDPCDNCKMTYLNCYNFPCIEKRAFEQGKSVFDVINEEKVDNANKVEPKFKDGNVLYSPTHHIIWIYKDNEHYYACVNMNYVTENVATDGLIKIPSDACPATNIQRDLLFQKIKEAGYGWDAEKKELKKLFQRMISAEAKEAMYNKPAWSEEDERQWNNIFDVLDGHFELSKEGYKNAANWFKAIKGRVQPQQEWSKDDKVMLDDIIDFFENGTVKLQHDLSLYASWLKSLKHRYTWKPSDEQMEILLSEVTAWKKGCSKQMVLESLYTDLKKLK